MKKILLVGGGGHCRSVIDCMLHTGEYDQIGIIDKSDAEMSLPSDIIFAGTDNDLQKLYCDGWKYAFVTVGSVGNTAVRRKLFDLLISEGFVIPNIIDSSAVISHNAILGKGIFVGKKVVVNSGASIADNAIINTGAIIEHDCTIGNFAHISPGAVLCGQVKVGADTHIGAGTVIRQGISIGSNTVIGIGSVVVKDIKDNSVAYGNPCKVVEKK